MRITNKIISNNSVTNINRNKVLEDKINTQLSTGSKINRPSDDPVVAIRALRLRTNLSQVNQYYKKNVPDAESWLDITESAITTVVDIVSDFYKNCEKGAAGFNTTEDRSKVLENLKSMQKEVYATGDADYAGRYVFSGYRTDTPVTFGNAVKQNYKITEQLTVDSLSDMTYVDSGKLKNMTEANAEGLGTTEQDVTSSTIHRMRLSYNKCSDTVAPTITYYDAGGNQQTMTAEIVSAYDMARNAYTSADQAADGVVYIPETGELILSDTAYGKLAGVKDNAATSDVDEGEIRVTYEKDAFEKNDLRPEHYFACTSGGIDYNAGYLTGATDDNSKQYISYDVGFNQSVRVNTLASELFTPALRRDMDDLISAIGDVDTMEKNISTLKDMLKKDPDNAELQERLDAANKSYTLMNDKMQKLFESSMTKAQGHLDLANSALTATGNRGSRVELVSNRLAKQQTNFKTLSSENEEVDITEVTVNLRSVELAYNASLMATGKIAQTTLLNYL